MSRAKPLGDASTGAAKPEEALPASQATAPYTRSKTVATWLAFVGGSIGLHRMYLHGLRDPWAWLHAVPTLIGVYGVQRMLELGQDDKTAWLLLPLLGLMLAGSMLTAIFYGLMPREKWDARFHGGGGTSWFTIVGVMLALMVGAGVLMATIAFAGQRWFEYEAEQQAHADARPQPHFKGVC